MDFKIGQASGVQLVSRHVETGLPVISNYLLTMGDLRVEVSFISRNNRGGDLSKYEEMLATIRVKEHQS
jgi:hypothetical protein